MIDTISGMLNLSDEMKDHFKNPANLNELEKYVKDYTGDINKTIANSFKELTGQDLGRLGSFDRALTMLSGNADPAAKSLIAFIEVLKELGYEVDKTTGDIRKDIEQPTEASVYAEAMSASGYAAEMRQRGIRNAIAQYA